MQQMPSITYSIKDGSILAKGGIPYAPRIFSDNRLTFVYDERGIVEVDYFGKNRINGSNKVFHEDIFSTLRHYVTVDGKRCLVTHEKCRIEPYGIYIDFKAEGIPFSLAIVAVHGQLVSALTIPKVAQGHTVRFSFDFFESNCFVPSKKNSKYLEKDFGMTREWSPIVFENGILFTSYRDYSETYMGETSLRIEADFPVSHKRIGIHASIRHSLESGALDVGTHSFRMVFNGEESLDLKTALSHQEKRYRDAKRRAPRLSSKLHGLDTFFSLCPYYMESLKTEDYPGAVKAKNIHYWIWGWDVLTYSAAFSQMGDTKFLRDACAFFRDYSSNGHLIHYYPFHMDRNRLHEKGDRSVVTSSLYPILLYNAFTQSGDKALLREFYPVAKAYIDSIAKTEVDNSGFFRGYSLYPDYYMAINETGNDLSSFNHTLYYCAFRAMEYLADEVNDKETLTALRRYMDAFEENYLAIFNDSEKGFPITSVDASTKEKRRIFYANSVKFENSYLFDVLAPVAEQHISFYKEHLINRAGICPLPENDPAYDADGNQLHYWFPVTGEYYIRLANRLHDKNAIMGYANAIGYWAEKLMCPEGINCHADTDAPAMDGWTTLNASWQAFSMRAWYTGALQSILGLIVEDGTLTVSPTDIGDFRLHNLRIGNKTANITVKGKGAFIGSIIVNGNRLIGTAKTPENLLDKSNEIIIIRNTAPKTTTLVSAHGAKLMEYTTKKATLAIRGTIRVEFLVADGCAPALDGIPLDTNTIGNRIVVTLRTNDKKLHVLTW